IDASQERMERAVREENSKNREEAANHAGRLRDELGATVRNFGDSLLKTMSEIAGLQKNQLEVFAQQLSTLTQSNEQRLDQMRETMVTRLTTLHDTSSANLDQMREAANARAQKAREEIASSLRGFNDSI